MNNTFITQNFVTAMIMLLIGAIGWFGLTVTQLNTNVAQITIQLSDFKEKMGEIKTDLDAVKKIPLLESRISRIEETLSRK